MANPVSLTAHVVVEFAEGDSNLQIIAEVDDREGGYNGGRTSFSPGATAYLLVFLPTGYEITHAVVSAGQLSYVGTDFKAIEDYVAFANADDASFQYPCTQGFTYSWLGNNLGALVPAGQHKMVLPARTFNPTTKKFTPEYRVGVAKINYSSACHVYKVSNVPLTVGQAMAFFVAKKSA